MAYSPFPAEWTSLVRMTKGRVTHRGSGWIFKPKIEVVGTYLDCDFRASQRGLGGPTILEMHGCGGAGLAMSFRNALHTGGSVLTGDSRFDNEVDWTVSHHGYAKLWLSEEARLALRNAEFWSFEFDAGRVTAKGSNDALTAAIWAMSRLALRGAELERRWSSVAEELAGSWSVTPFSLDSSATLTVMERGVHTTIAPRTQPDGSLVTLFDAHAPESPSRIPPNAVQGGVLLESHPGRATISLPGFVDDVRRLRAVLDAIAASLGPRLPYR